MIPKRPPLADLFRGRSGHYSEDEAAALNVIPSDRKSTQRDEILVSPTKPTLPETATLLAKPVAVPFATRQ